MRKPFAILFVLLLLVQSGGYLLFFKAEQLRIRHEVKEEIFKSLPDDQLEILSFSESSQTFLTCDGRFINDHEIQSDGIMYDVIRMEKDGDTIMYYCFADHQESQLVQKIDQLINQNSRQNPATIQHLHLLQHLIQPYYPPNGPFCPVLADNPNPLISNYQFPVQSWIKLPEDPPPQGLLPL